MWDGASASAMESPSEWDSAWSLLAVGQRRVLEVEAGSCMRGSGKERTGQVGQGERPPVKKRLW